MKIIDIAKCIDNVDPLGIGRIRCQRYNDIIGQKERALDYNAWEDNDLFTAAPFLPTNINYIPEIGQSVKIITYNSQKENVNVEYIAGPFTTQYDYNSQTFSQQTSITTYGTTTKKKSNIRNIDGKFIDKRSVNVLAKDKDFAIYGKYGSDVIFTENGLQLRGGKLISKESGNNLTREKMIDSPLLAKKYSRIYLKKFPKKMVYEDELTQEIVYDNKNLNYLVEYTVSGNTSAGSTNTNGLNPSSTYPTTISLYVYKILNPNGEQFKVNYFNEHTVAPSGNLKLINLNSSLTGATHTQQVNGINEIYIEIRNRLFEMHDLGLVELDDNYNSDDLHPFFFRPTTGFRNLSGTTSTEIENKSTILRNVNTAKIGPTSGLVFSARKAKMTSQTVNTIVKKLKFIDDSAEQTFGSILSDKIYFLSSDLGTNESPNPVPFINLNEYELTQEDYIKRIEPSTFSTVRGENLLEVLRKIIDVILTHRHNPLMPIVNQPDYQDGNELKELYKTLENDILNKSIRIN
jgi:hypothetical protein